MEEGLVGFVACVVLLYVFFSSDAEPDFRKSSNSGGRTFLLSLPWLPSIHPACCTTREIHQTYLFPLPFLLLLPCMSSQILLDPSLVYPPVPPTSRISQCIEPGVFPQGVFCCFFFGSVFPPAPPGFRLPSSRCARLRFNDHDVALPGAETIVSPAFRPSPPFLFLLLTGGVKVELHNKYRRRWSVPRVISVCLSRSYLLYQTHSFLCPSSRFFFAFFPSGVTNPRVRLYAVFACLFDTGRIGCVD